MNDKKIKLNKIARTTKCRAYDTSRGKTVLNPMKRLIKGKPYKNGEYQSIMMDEIRTLKGLNTEKADS
jgi:hypothetical protein